MNTLKNTLEKRNITISSFAKNINATSQQVCNWFSRGNIPKNFVIPISKALDMSIEEVLNLKASTEIVTNNEKIAKV